MLRTLSNQEYLHLVNAGRTPLPQFQAGVYAFGGKYVAYRKEGKTQASLGQLRDTETEAQADADQPLEKIEAVTKADFDKFSRLA